MSWLVIGGVGLALILAVVIPRLAGAVPFTILSGSMTPALAPGSLVVVRPTPPQELGVGSVITYQLESRKPLTVTHRVHAQGLAADGRPVFWTKGDANSAVDAKPVRPEQVKGKVWYAVPQLGRVTSALSGEQRQVLVAAAVGGLLLYAAAMFAGAARDRMRARTPA